MAPKPTTSAHSITFPKGCPAISCSAPCRSAWPPPLPTAIRTDSSPISTYTTPRATKPARPATVSVSFRVLRAADFAARPRRCVSDEVTMSSPWRARGTRPPPYPSARSRALASGRPLDLAEVLTSGTARPRLVGVPDAPTEIRSRNGKRSRSNGVRPGPLRSPLSDSNRRPTHYKIARALPHSSLPPPVFVVCAVQRAWGCPWRVDRSRGFIALPAPSWTQVWAGPRLAWHQSGWYQAQRKHADTPRARHPNPSRRTSHRGRWSRSALRHGPPRTSHSWLSPLPRSPRLTELIFRMA